MKDSIDRCDLCGGELKPGQTVLEIWRGAEMLVIKDVPAGAIPGCASVLCGANYGRMMK